MKKILNLFLLLSLVLGALHYVSINKVEDKKKVSDDLPREKSADLYEELIDSFSKKNNESDEIDNVSYPDNYAGSYINDDGKLVICQTHPNEKISPFLEGKEDDVIYKLVDYSYNELVDIMTSIAEYTERHSKEALSKNINGYGIYDDVNQVVVTMSDISEKMINDFNEKIISSRAVKIEYGEAATKCEYAK